MNDGKPHLLLPRSSRSGRDGAVPSTARVLPLAQMFKRVPFLLFAVLAAALLFGAVVRVALLVPPRYPLLERTLGEKATNPGALLNVLAQQTDDKNPYGLEPHQWSDLQHQALLRLIDLQKPRFGVASVRPAVHGDGAESSFAHVETRTGKTGTVPGSIVVVGTQSREPDHWDKTYYWFGFWPVHEEGYYYMERFYLTPEDRLVKREPYSVRP